MRFLDYFIILLVCTLLGAVLGDWHRITRLEARPGCDCIVDDLQSRLQYQSERIDTLYELLRSK